LKTTLAATVLGGCGVRASEDPGSAASAQGTKPPVNILVILVDEMRPPPGFPYGLPLNWSSVLSNMIALWSESACFTNHFTAASDCTPSRGTLVTGLYAQQHWLLTTRTGPSPSLQTAFPTYGTMLRKQGYSTAWYGKWHLSDVSGATNPLEGYGFSQGTSPDPDGSAGQGAEQDGNIANQFVTWLGKQSPSAGPWCMTVSFVNPHDVQWFWTGSDCLTNAAAVGETDPPVNGYDASYFAQWGGNPCANFEVPGSTTTVKPDMQLAFANFTAKTWGPISWSQSTLLPATPAPVCPVPSDPSAQPFNYWYKLLQLYLYVQGLVDQQIGVVMNALKSSPFADNTVVVFTSDHGEYAGAHGQRGKGGMGYDEAMRVPLSVYDPTGQYVASPGVVRTGLTSSADLAPLLVTIAGRGSTSPWSASGSPYSYLSGRFDLSTMLANPAAPGRSYVLYSTDECFPGIDPTEVASHVLSYRTAQAKLNVYSYWQTGTVTIDTTQAQQLELYDYRGGDTSEVSNVASSSSLTTPYEATPLGTGSAPGLMATELQAPLPSYLQSAQQQAITQYVEYAPIAARA
jgi:arylsulfatase A-like enzyme